MALNYQSAFGSWALPGPAREAKVIPQPLAVIRDRNSEKRSFAEHAGKKKK